MYHDKLVLRRTVLYRGEYIDSYTRWVGTSPPNSRAARLPPPPSGTDSNAADLGATPARPGVAQTPQRSRADQEEARMVFGASFDS